MKGHGSFWINKKAADQLAFSNASAAAICIYLIIARFTGADNCFSRVGITGIYERLATTKKLVADEIEWLIDNNLIITSHTYTTSHYNPNTDPELPNYKKHEVTYVIVHSTLDRLSHKRIWFSNDLIGGKLKGSPLARLFRFKNPRLAAILLLALHIYYINDSGVCDIAKATFSRLTDCSIDNHNNLHIFTGRLSKKFTFTNRIRAAAFGINESEIQEHNKIDMDIQLNRALNHLYNSGLIDFVIAISDADNNSHIYYELDVKKGDNSKKIPEECYCIQIERALRANNLRPGSPEDRIQFRDKYVALLEDTAHGQLACYIRPRYIVTNPANTPAMEALSRKKRNQSHVEQLIAML